MLGLVRNQKAHCNEMLRRAVASSFRFGRLNQRVDRLHIASVQQSLLKGLHNAQPMAFDGLGQIRHWMELRALSPTQPTLQGYRGLIRVSLARIDIPERLLDPPSLGRL